MWSAALLSRHRFLRQTRRIGALLAFLGHIFASFVSTHGLMERVGDELAGFSFGYDKARDIFEVIAWGFWNAEVAIAFGVKVTAALRQRLGSKRLVFDMSDLKPMRNEGQQSCASLFRALSALGVTSTTVVTTSHLTKLQLVRLAAESGAVDMQWLSGNAERTRNA